MAYHRRLENSVNKLSEDVLSLENKIVCLEKLVIEKFDAIKELLLDKPRANSVTKAVDVTNVTPTVRSARKRSVRPLATSRASSVTEAVDDTNISTAVKVAPRRSQSPDLGVSAPKRANCTIKVTNNRSIAASTSTTNSTPEPETTVDSKQKGTTFLKKLIRKKEKAQRGRNKRALGKALNDLAEYYEKHKQYNEALDEYEFEATIWKDLGVQMNWGNCNNRIGEMYMMMNKYKEALEYEDRHLAVAKELNNLFEEMRGMNARGLILLTQGQGTDSDEDVKVLMNAALEAFIEGLSLSEKLIGKINERELMEAKVVMYNNVALVQENLGFFDKCLKYSQSAISICEEHKLYNDLHECYIKVTELYCEKIKDYDKALYCINKALNICNVTRLKDKIIKTCHTLSKKAEILCKMSDYESAKHVLHKAWKLKTPDEDKRKNIECKLKAVASICYTKYELQFTDSSDHNTFKKFYEKLGDAACYAGNHSDSIDYYLKMLHHAKLAGDSGKALIPIYDSLSYTYRDMGSFAEAVDYYEKSYELVKDVPKESVVTLYWYTDTLFLAKRPYDQVEKAWFRARNAARDCQNRKDEIFLLEALLKYQEEYNEIEKMVDTKLALSVLGNEDSDNLEYSEIKKATTSELYSTPLGNDICLDDLTDIEEEEDVTDTQNEKHKKGREYIIRKNNMNETQLHVACSSGNKQLVKQLIGKGHSVNTRDNAGWLPVHEACIHGHIEIVEILINSGADVNDRGGADCDGTTPLHNAASKGHLEIVQLLLESGAQPSLKTDKGETPLHVLDKWQAGTNLDIDAEILYSDVCNKMRTNIDKFHATDIINTSISETYVEAETNFAATSTDNLTNITKDPKGTSIFRRKIIMEDDSDNDESQASDDLNFDDTSDKCDQTLIKEETSDTNEQTNRFLTVKNEVDDDDCFDDDWDLQKHKK